MKFTELSDGFLLSASQLYNQASYRAQTMAQMEVLRRAAAYRTRHYTVPEKDRTVIPAYSQVEEQVSLQPGAYVWGLTFSAPFDEISNPWEYIHLQLTDACTETPFFSDYIYGTQLKAPQAAAGNFVVRNPVILPQPRLIGDPGLINAEIYNRADVDIDCQLVILVSEPAIPPEQIQQLFESQRIQQMIS